MSGEEEIDFMSGIPTEDDLGNSPNDELESVDDALARLGESQNADKIEILEDEPEEPAKTPAQTETKKDDDDPLDEIVFDDDDNEILASDVESEGEDFEPEDKTSKAWKSRLGREQRLKQKSYEREDKLQAAIPEYTKRVAKAESDFLRVRRNAASITKELLSGYESSVQANIAMAEEAGDAEKAQGFRDEMMRVRQAQSSADDVLRDSPSDEQLRNYVPKNLPQVEARPVVNALAQSWKDNNSWFDDPKHAAKRAAVEAIDREMGQSGMDTSSPQYFNKLSIRISKEFPDLEVQNHEGRRVRRKADAKTGGRKRGGQRRDVTGPSRHIPTTRPRRGKGGKTIRLNGAEKFMMESLGLDFSNPEHVKEFAANHTDE